VDGLEGGGEEGGGRMDGGWRNLEIQGLQMINANIRTDRPMEPPFSRPIKIDSTA
jgi:hypothetical protein